MRILAALIALLMDGAHAAERPRVFVLTDANHPPVATLGHPNRLNAAPGERVNLSARGCSDPDGDSLSYVWSDNPEPVVLRSNPGVAGSPPASEHAREPDAGFTVPANYFHAGTIHIILAVTDDGSRSLTRYRRVIVTVP